MVKDNLVSIIVPCYNSEETIAKLVVSVINQTYKNYELLIVDDGCTDKTVEIVKSFIIKHSNIRLLEYGENRGVSYARNFALKRAEGKYVTFLDSDDWLDIDFLSTLVSYAEKSSADVILSGSRNINDSGKVLKSICYYESKKSLYKFSACAKLYRKDYLERINAIFPVGKNYEDNCFSMKALFLSDKIKEVGYIGYNRLVHEGSITTKVIKKEVLPFNEMEENIRFVLKNQKNKNVLDLFMVHVLCFFIFFQFKMLGGLRFNTKNGDRKTQLAYAKYCEKIVRKYIKIDKNRYLNVFNREFLKIYEKIAIIGYYYFANLNLLNVLIKILSK